MKIKITLANNIYQADLSEPIDISIPLEAGSDTVNCFYAPFVKIEPFKSGDFVGSIEAGAPVNFMNITINPHGNGTHTECVGHISKEIFTIHRSLKKFHFSAQLLSVYPTKMENGDRVITKKQLDGFLLEGVESLVIRTLPNQKNKLKQHYSGMNPPYIDADAMAYIVDQGIQHLLLDLPSVDREEDDGKLAAHHIFWKYPENIRTNCTITELIYVENEIKDGLYLLNIQISSFEMDAVPSKPVLYALTMDH